MRLIAGVATATIALPAAVAGGESPVVYVFDTVTLTGDPAPGTTDTLKSFADPVLNGAGEVAFLGYFGAAMNQGIFEESGGTITAVALEGDPAPGTTDTFTAFGVLAPVLDDIGVVALRGLFGSAFPSGTSGIFKEGGGTLGEVALTGDAVPGTIDTFTNFGDPVVNGAGQVAFHGFFGDAFSDGIFKASEGTLDEVALTGHPAPGTADTFGAFGVPRLNGAGDTAFQAFLGDAALGATGIFKESGGTLGKVALPGDPAPGTTATFTGFGDPALSGAGDTAFVGAFGATSALGAGAFRESGRTRMELALARHPKRNGRNSSPRVGASVLYGTAEMPFVAFSGAAIDQGVFKESGGTLAAVALSNDPAPGTTEMFIGFSAPVLNGASAVAFLGRFGATPSDMGLFTDSGGTLTAVALVGDPAPGTTHTFSFFNYPFPVLNGRGEVAFTVVLGAPGGEIPDPGEGSGVFVFDPFQAQVGKILAAGDMLEVAPGDVREVREVLLRGPSGNQDGRASGFNDRGQAALRVVFAGGSQAIVRATPADAALDD